MLLLIMYSVNSFYQIPDCKISEIILLFLREEQNSVIALGREKDGYFLLFCIGRRKVLICVFVFIFF